MIILDFSQIAIGAITADAYNKPNADIELGYVRHLIVNTIRNNYNRFKREYGPEMVLACDAKNYWRKDFFPHYKCGRKKSKEDSKLDWTQISFCLEAVRDELKEVMPYPVVCVPKAEGDDVIAILAEWAHSNVLVTDGMWEGEPSPLLVISGDGDGVQLQRFPNVKNYSPKKKAFLTTGGLSVEEFINEHIAEGDGTDSIPNVLSQDNSFADKIRQKSLFQARKDEFIAHGIDACKTEEERKNFVRNQTLVDFQFIPEDIKEATIMDYLEQSAKCKKRGRMKVMNYLVKNRMSLLLEHLDEF